MEHKQIILLETYTGAQEVQSLATEYLALLKVDESFYRQKSRYCGYKMGITTLGSFIGK